MKPTKDTLRLMRSTQNVIARCEKLMASNLSKTRVSREEIIKKYNLIEFV